MKIDQTIISGDPIRMYLLTRPYDDRTHNAFERGILVISNSAPSIVIVVERLLNEYEDL